MKEAKVDALLMSGNLTRTVEMLAYEWYQIIFEEQNY